MKQEGETEPEIPDPKPYKGTDSYWAEDRHLFFGRDRDAKNLAATILSSRFSLLHARSATGKTSLLNARIIPELESAGWSPVCLTPQQDPILAVRSATVCALLPSPELEIRAIRRVIRNAEGIGPESSLGEVLDWFDQLNMRDPVRARVIFPYNEVLPLWDAKEDDKEWITPFFCRLLRSTIDIDRFEEQLNAIAGADSRALKKQFTISRETPLGELLDEIDSDGVRVEYELLTESIDIPGRNLLLFFENLVYLMGQRVSNLQIVLIIDQFEELFTRFVREERTEIEDNGLEPTWRKREEFFEELEKLYSGRREHSSAPRRTGGVGVYADQVLPVWILISIRDEYIAELDRIRRFVWDLDRNSFHLDNLSESDAMGVIQSPAKIYGYEYEDNCYREILRDLIREERYLKPAEVQIVCDQLWEETGKNLSAGNGDASESSETKEISLEKYLNLGRAENLIKEFINKLLPERRDSRVALLEMLDRLVTEDKTRDIVSLRTLCRQPFRNADQMRKVIEKAGKDGIVRIEERLGGKFVEIAHEFLIESIREAIGKELTECENYQEFRNALRSLERSEEEDARSVLLSRNSYRSIANYWENLDLPYWAAAAMLRAAIEYEFDEDDKAANPKAVLQWADEVRVQYNQLTGEELTGNMERYLSQNRRFDFPELEIVRRENPTAVNFSENQKAFLIASLITNTRKAREGELKDWISWLEPDHGQD